MLLDTSKPFAVRIPHSVLLLVKIRLCGNYQSFSLVHIWLWNNHLFALVHDLLHLPYNIIHLIIPAIFSLLLNHLVVWGSVHCRQLRFSFGCFLYQFLLDCFLPQGSWYELLLLLFFWSVCRLAFNIVVSEAICVPRLVWLMVFFGTEITCLKFLGADG